MSREWSSTGLVEGPVSEAQKAQAEVERLRDHCEMARAEAKAGLIGRSDIRLRGIVETLDAGLGDRK